MSAFLTDTLVWTGVLLALVLMIRRPVAALFGPKVAYALWALPMARLLLPPLVLPAWMAPAAEPVAEPALEIILAEPLAGVASEAPTLALAEIAPAPTLFDTLAAMDWAAVLLPIWLLGAALFLLRRYALYFEMRRELLAAARPMGEAGRVRLVETPAADGPVAFGVIDKVIALPTGFMAGHDRAARDLALAHELAHHRGHDLVCNMLVQPLFALHWFNPLSILGWRALRRDQEAACDARVMAREPRERRAAYAAVIASFATQPRHAGRLALAAPMACPVLGDRSIVQRLKSLTMTDISARRRWAGRLLIGASVLALPLTGSISYAQSVPAAPIPPAPPAAATVPTPPDAPQAPEAPGVTVGEDGKVRVVRIERTLRRGEGTGKNTDRTVERQIIIRNGGKMSAEELAQIEKDMADGTHGKRHVVLRDGKPMSAKERAEFDKDMAELRRELREELGEHGELQRELKRELGEDSAFQKEMREKFGANGEFRREMRLAIASANAAARVHAVAAVPATRVSMSCREGQKDVAETVVVRDGGQRVFVCSALAHAQAARALASARAEIAHAPEISEIRRAQALRSLDQAERELRAD